MLITISEEEYKELMEFRRSKNKMVSISENRYDELISTEIKYNAMFEKIKLVNYDPKDLMYMGGF